MELSELRLAVRERLGEDVQDFWTDVQLNRLLNEAQRRFCNEEKWDWLYVKGFDSLAATGDGTLELQEGVQPTRHMNILLTSTTLVYPLLPTRVSPLEGFKARRRYFITRGFPRWWYLDSTFEEDEEGNGVFTPVIQFVPRPAVDLDVEYQYLLDPPEMSGEADEPVVPETYQMALVHHATAQAWLKELMNGEQKAGAEMSQYQSILADATDELRHLGMDDILAWGKEEPELVGMSSLQDWISSRIPPSVGV